MDQPKSEFEQEAQKNAGRNILTDFWFFLLHNKKWWMVPLLLLLLLLAALIGLSSSGIAPFIYTLF